MCFSMCLVVVVDSKSEDHGVAIGLAPLAHSSNRSRLGRRKEVVLVDGSALLFRPIAQHLTRTSCWIMLGLSCCVALRAPLSQAFAALV